MSRQIHESSKYNCRKCLTQDSGKSLPLFPPICKYDPTSEIYKFLKGPK